MTSILLYNKDNIYDNIINYIQPKDISKNKNYDSIFSLQHDIYNNANILDIKYKNNEITEPYNIWDKRTVGDNSNTTNIINEDIRNAYKIVKYKSKVVDYDHEKVIVYKNVVNEHYVYVLEPCKSSFTSYYNVYYDININNLSNNLRNELHQLNRFLVDTYGSNYKYEAKYNFIRYDYSLCKTTNSSGYQNVRKWKVNKYEVNGFFKPHNDTKINEYHIGTLVLIPPENYSYYEGGILRLFNDDETIESEVVPDKEGWKCVFIPVGKIHEITTVTSGTRYSFTSPYFITEVTKQNISSIHYYNSIDEKIMNSLVSNYTQEKIKSIDEEINKLIAIRDNLKNTNNISTYYHNNVINTIDEQQQFIIICENFYDNPTPENLKFNDAITYNSIFNKFSSDNIVNIKFLNLGIYIEAGSSEEPLNYTNKDEWGYITRGRNYDDDDSDNIKVIYNNSMINEIKLKYLLNTNPNDYTYHHYNEVYCYYNGTELPGKFTHNLSDYNDEYYTNSKALSVSLMVVELE